ncbi:hypothetical protein FKM82_009554 [Ascaphus truei]
MSSEHEFFGVWKSQGLIVKTLFTALILFLLEEMMEVEFVCPPQKIWVVLYSLTFFFFPSMICFFLTLFSQRKSFLFCRYNQNWNCSYGSSVCKACVPPIIWIIILLFDGRYVECLFRSFNFNGIEISDTKIIPIPAYFISQMMGIAGFFLLVVIFMLVQYYPVWHCNCGCFKKEGRDYDEIERENRMVQEASAQTWEKMEGSNKQAVSEIIKENKLLENILNPDFSKLVSDVQQKVTEIFRSKWKDLPMINMPSHNGCDGPSDETVRADAISSV